MQRSAPQRTLVVLLSLILGGFIGVGAAFVASVFESVEKDAEEQSKLEEIRERLVPLRYQSSGQGSSRSDP
jgi:hypothetical protein